MTDRIRTLHVILAKDVRTDDVENIRTLLLMVRGVASVEDGPAVASNDHLQRRIAGMEMRRALMELIDLGCSADDATYRQVLALLRGRGS